MKYEYIDWRHFMELESYMSKLKDAGYKSTKARQALISTLIQHRSNFLSAEGLFDAFKKEYPEINVSTVYRNLAILEELGIVHKLNGDDGIAKYKLMETNEHHHHIICKNCGKTAIIDFCPMSILNPFVDKKDFTLTDHKLELYGYCKDCDRNNS